MERNDLAKRAEEVKKREEATRQVMTSHDISWQEYFILVDSAKNEPESEAGKLAWTILDSIFKEIEEKVNRSR